jgi:rhamnosyltransferase
MKKLIVPTLNAAADWARFSSALLDCAAPGEVLIVDSSSTDGTADLARAAGFQVHSIPGIEFNHGGTRQLAAEMLTGTEILVYLTQDAILQGPTSVNSLLKAFDDDSVAAAYGRQLPRIGAKPIETHARLFNYPPTSDLRSAADRERLGFKSIFISNSFAAYRRSALLEVGGFPTTTIFGEDTVVAAKLLVSGWKIAYVSEAQVYHSHDYTWGQELKRYFDIGVLHSREAWLLDEFGKVGGEGKRFVLSELAYLWPRHVMLIPAALARTFLKLLGYRLGRIESRLNLSLKRRLSMHRRFWN